MLSNWATGSLRIVTNFVSEPKKCLNNVKQFDALHTVRHRILGYNAQLHGGPVPPHVKGRYVIFPPLHNLSVTATWQDTIFEALHREVFNPRLKITFHNGGAEKKFGMLTPAVPQKDILDCSGMLTPINKTCGETLYVIGSTGFDPERH